MYYIISQSPDSIKIVFLSKSKAKRDKVYKELLKTEQDEDEGYLLYIGYQEVN